MNTDSLVPIASIAEQLRMLSHSNITASKLLDIAHAADMQIHGENPAVSPEDAKTLRTAAEILARGQTPRQIAMARSGICVVKVTKTVIAAMPSNGDYLKCIEDILDPKKAKVKAFIQAPYFIAVDVMADIGGKPGRITHSRNFMGATYEEVAEKCRAAIMAHPFNVLDAKLDALARRLDSFSLVTE